MPDGESRQGAAAKGRLTLVMPLVYFEHAMHQVSVHEAKTQLSRLLRQAVAGEEVVITRSGLPVARLVPIEEARAPYSGLTKGVSSSPTISMNRSMRSC